MVLRRAAGGAAAMSARAAALAGVAAASEELGPPGCWEEEAVGLDDEEGFALATAGDAAEAEGVEDAAAGLSLDEGLLAEEALLLDAVEAVEASLEAGFAAGAAALEELGPLDRWEGDPVGLDEGEGLVLATAGDAADAD